MQLADELDRIAAAAAAHAAAGETVAAVLAAEPVPDRRTYLCAFAGGDGRTWLALDARGRPVAERRAVRDAVAIVALCEIAAETAGGGDLDELHRQLVALRLTEQPEGIEEAEEAVLALQREIGAPPQLATPDRLDAIAAAARRLEAALDASAGSPLASALQAAQGAVEELTREIETGYRLELQ